MSNRRLLALCLLAGCASAAPPADHPVEPAPPPQVTAEAPPASPWEGQDTAALARLVREGAATRIHEAQPSFDLAQLDQYRAAPDQAPVLLGRTVDGLIDLAIVDLAQDRLDDAEKTVRLVRARASNRNSAFAGTTLLSEAARRRAGDDPEAQKAAIATVLRELPRARFGAATVVFQLFQTQAQLDAQVEETKQKLLSSDTARDVLWYGAVMPGVVAHRDGFLAACTAVRAENDAHPPDRDYRFSTVDLTHARDAHEVVVAVWDVGVSPALFESQLFTNTAEEPNGRDDDGNGQVDDIHGIVADGTAPNTALLFDPGAQTIAQYAPFLRGVMDLRAGMASTPAAQRVLELERSVTDLAQLKTLDRSLDAIGEWGHGTHVAGILLKGNPFARLAIFRSSWAGESRVYYERGPTDAELDAERRNMEALADYIRRHHVRVVNASLGFTSDYLEDQLRHEAGRYPTDEAVRARAREVQARRRANWAFIFEQCPDTLFVVAAGNDNQDVVEYGEVSASIDAPNVLPVGAVDRWGNWAVFTNSNAERVRVFDHGVEVDSVIPSGDHVPLSGTSMASPNVANLAGKLFALDTALTPPRAIAAIVETGDPIAAPFNGHIANEERAVARIRRERSRH